ncbi:protein serine/threonine phosphatase 2C [Pluteus cervinus]|uniref:Protein serine/threonine phosphatase 2C n=1 Tax=Pluteus cervinus TaxID=181527 RepID=A0ACD3AF06_9AGAR|nr:protein serine/threonine phosphatase 2C [Pluteus cervinus]
MLLSRTSYNWAYSEDIPGSRCGPEDGPWPRAYQVLEENELWKELNIMARPQTRSLETSATSSNERGWRADMINFQPSPTTRTQDRYIVTTLDLHGQKWTLTGVFDGHLGDATVEHVAHHLPIIIRDFMRDALANATPSTITPAYISELFSKAIVAFDDAIAGDVLDLFGGIEGLENFSDAQIRSIINDRHRGGANWQKVRLCMYGTTALVALVDPEHQNLWVANLGDCQAVMVTSRGDEDGWNVEMLTTNHNGDNDAEVERVRLQHPGEPECVIDRRVLGALAPFRCLGDVPFKQPPEFTRRILYNLLPGFQNTSPWEEFLVRNRTPPYITAEPEVTHIKLDEDGQDSEKSRRRRFLVLSSDGFTDLCSGEGQKRIVESWAREMDERMTLNEKEAQQHQHHQLKRGPLGPSNNMALRLLRRALGGEDRYSVSRVLTLDMEVAWIDDTSIIVQTL